MNESEIEAAKSRASVGSVIGWAVFILVLAGMAYIGYRTWYYYDKIRRGEIVDLSFYAHEMTETAGQKRLVADYADPQIVDDAAAPSFGAAPAAAQLVVVEFGDFHCAYSREVASVFREMMTKYGDRVRFLYRDFPTGSVTDPIEAALAARCAGVQNKYWQFYDKLYANQDRLGSADLVEYASQANLDVDRFEKCLQERQFEAAIAKDIADARAAEVRGTPTFFFGGNRVEGALSRQVFEKIIETLLQ